MRTLLVASIYIERINFSMLGEGYKSADRFFIGVLLLALGPHLDYSLWGKLTPNLDRTSLEGMKNAFAKAVGNLEITDKDILHHYNRTATTPAFRPPLSSRTTTSHRSRNGSSYNPPLSPTGQSDFSSRQDDFLTPTNTFSVNRHGRSPDISMYHSSAAGHPSRPNDSSTRRSASDTLVESPPSYGRHSYSLHSTPNQRGFRGWYDSSLDQSTTPTPTQSNSRSVSAYPPRWSQFTTPTPTRSDSRTVSAYPTISAYPPSRFRDGYTRGTLTELYDPPSSVWSASGRHAWDRSSSSSTRSGTGHGGKRVNCNVNVNVNVMGKKY